MKFIKNSLILSIIVAIGCFLLVGKMSLLCLKWYTKYNQETYLPNFIGKDIRKINKLLEDKGFEVEVDSTFNPNLPPGQIIMQIPKGNKVVKSGRTVILIVNNLKTPTIPSPNFVNFSFRSAIMQMRNLKLQMGDTVYKFDMTKGIVLEQWMNGKLLLPGTEIPLGSKIDLVVSKGLGVPNIQMPLLIGKSYADAMKFVDMNRLVVNIFWVGNITDSANAKVFDQNPMHIDVYGQANYVAEGEAIDLFVMQNPSDSLIKAKSHVNIIQMMQDDDDIDMEIENDADNGEIDAVEPDKGSSSRGQDEVPETSQKPKPETSQKPKSEPQLPVEKPAKEKESRVGKLKALFRKKETNTTAN